MAEGTRQAVIDLDVTTEMVEAGREALWRSGADINGDQYRAVREIYLAMMQARHNAQGDR